MNIIGIGIDSVDIERFSGWTLYSAEQLKRVFSADELQYSFAVSRKTPERLAVRFAAKEAFYKAFCGALACDLPFSAICRNVAVKRQDSGIPYLEIDWIKLLGSEQQVFAHLSLTHTKTVATALVIIEKIRGK